MNEDKTKILLNMVRKIAPSLIASEIAGVQPMQSEAGELFKSHDVEWSCDCYGDIAHHFIGGWKWYGNVDGEYDWVSINDKDSLGNTRTWKDINRDREFNKIIFETPHDFEWCNDLKRELLEAGFTKEDFDLEEARRRKRSLFRQFEDSKNAK